MRTADGVRVDGLTGTSDSLGCEVSLAIVGDIANAAI